MPTYKFKIGDKVRVVRAARKHKEAHIGRVFTIREINPNGVWGETRTHYGIVETDTCSYIWFDSELELVTDEKIVITHNGKVTTATLYGEFGKKTATASCAPEDTFDFMTGAKLALERLEKDIKKPEPPKYWTGRVVCLKSNDDDFTVGKIYKCDNGKIIDNDGGFRPCTGDRVTKSDDLTDNNSTNPFSSWWYKFIPIVE